jgi:hypothetical protein
MVDAHSHRAEPLRDQERRRPWGESRFRMRGKMRAFLEQYEDCLSHATAADRVGSSPRLPYTWKRRTDRLGRWFVLALERAEHVGVQRVRADAFHCARVKRSESAIFAILRARDPWLQPQPKQVEVKHRDAPPPPSNVSISSTSIAFGHFTDEEMATFDRLLKKRGVPEHLINPTQPPIDVDAQPVTEAQPSRGDGTRGLK